MDVLVQGLDGGLQYQRACPRQASADDNTVNLTEKVLDHNGYHTRDIGYQDEEGYFYVVGRKDNILKVGGYRINPQEVESGIMDTGLLSEIAVLGIPDEQLGDRLIALATSKNGKCSKKEILGACLKYLPRYKLPSEVILMRSLPKKASGKIDIEKCREIANSNL